MKTYELSEEEREILLTLLRIYEVGSRLSEEYLDKIEVLINKFEPKKVKKEGWMNVYKATLPNHIGMACTSNVYASKEEALAEKRYDIEPTDTVLVSWEEAA